MSLTRTLQNLASRALLSPGARDAGRKFHKTKRRLRGQPRVVEYFHQIDDPYSHLAAQTLQVFAKRYAIELRIHLVDAPSDQAAPDRERLVAYSRHDASSIAPYYGLRFVDPGHQPDPDSCRRASEILTLHLDEKKFSALGPRVGEVLWSGTTEDMLELSNEFPTASEEQAATTIAAGTQRRKNLGHYNGATFYFEGEWYWGIDRLHYLEKRLQQEGADKDNRPGFIAPPPELSLEAVPDTDTRITLEYFPSLRSPYSAISSARTFALEQTYSLDLVLKPVLPMVMRGLSVPLAKRLYIMRDTRREADRIGLPFGNMFDPVGEPVERAFSLYPFAERAGRAKEFLARFMTGTFCDGVDTGTDQGLREIVESSGLSWKAAEKELHQPGWQEVLAQNREDMLAAGVWGVPSYRIRSDGEPDFTIWGQDRIWLVEKEIRRRLDLSHD